ncbi:hypothetical protein SY86_13545 [Erwinia tracheiphila]|uniref:Uncharacterized protein n=1 Tax=Erwinia tracheiphila TaxID=65700 RepID=A0A0M2KG68_9GAMM|nr:hypothetical protein AV903_17035 [Erwinia tracheiphila]EOS95095.1 hypothetical protein ETR_10227 [Erwinia tracheiphila PSU-1]KKF36228.1 hypothetical protein SY86_13545 [Erwinia tracheiphila]
MLRPLITLNVILLPEIRQAFYISDNFVRVKSAIHTHTNDESNMPDFAHNSTTILFRNGFYGYF